MSILKQSSPPDTARVPTIEPANPPHPFTLKPLIANLLRTRLCVQGSIFLVEGVDAHVAVSHDRRVVRLLLGDGRLCVQALLTPSLHGLVHAGHVCAGCYIRADAFQARFVEIPDSENNGEEDTAVTAAAKKARLGVRKMVYLLLEDVTPVGWSNDLLEMLRPNDGAAEPVPKATYLEERRTKEGDSMYASLVEEAGSFPGPRLAEMPAAFPQTEARKGSVEAEPGLSKESHPDSTEDDSDADSAFETMRVSDTKAIERRVESRTTPRFKQETSGKLPWTSSDPTQPVKLTSLHAIPNLPYKQNWMVNILAVVVSLSDVEPSRLPPFTQRAARLADPSTSKQVLLTVFLDPEAFAPKIGSVVLLFGVKNHRFEGGSLKKYVSDRPKGGLRWWYEEPWELEWCDVAGLKSWWEEEGHKNILPV